ncbi:MAG: BMP family protein [Anaerolineaceae bacterium]|nr:BMP family protein [Anaerolineaceae bacterium]
MKSLRLTVLCLLISVSVILSSCSPAATPAAPAAPAATTAPAAPVATTAPAAPAATTAPAAPAATTAPAAPAATTAPAAPAATSASSSPVGESLALVLTGPHDDDSWNFAAYNAANALKAKGVKVAISENIAEGSEENVLREYVSEGYKMVVADSFGYEDGVFKVAGESPNVDFAWAGGIQKTATNVADYDQPFYEAAYPVGIIAGAMSKSGKLGAIYGSDIPVCHAMGEALLAGAKTINPNAQLVVTAVGDWVDVSKAETAALAQADAGVDFWIECGEGPALGTIKAAQQKGGYVTGYVSDMIHDGPDVVLTNILWNMEPLFQKMLDDVSAGKFNNPWYEYGVKEGTMLYNVNPALQAKIPATALAAAVQAMQDIKDGKLTVKFVPK